MIYRLIGHQLDPMRGVIIRMVELRKKHKKNTHVTVVFNARERWGISERGKLGTKSHRTHMITNESLMAHVMGLEWQKQGVTDACP